MNAPANITWSKARQRMLRKLGQWDGLCVICGSPFTNIDSMTSEHLAPRSLNLPPEYLAELGNRAPSHYSCNQMRGSISLVEAMLLADRRRRSWGDVAFERWANRSLGSIVTHGEDHAGQAPSPSFRGGIDDSHDDAIGA